MDPRALTPNAATFAALLLVALLVSLQDRRARSAAALLCAVLSAAVLALAPACTPQQAATVAPALADVASRVDLARVLACAGKPDRWRCLGAAAASAALDAAADRAEQFAGEARSALSGTGADDVDEDALAVELDRALSDLGAAIAAAGD